MTGAKLIDGLAISKFIVNAINIKRFKIYRRVPADSSPQSVGYAGTFIIKYLKSRDIL